MENYHFITRALHTKYAREDIHGALRMPVYDTVAFEYKKAEELEEAFLGTKPGHVYSRSTNPTVEHLERVLVNLTNSLGAIALSSGMAAISNLILSLTSSGDNIITTKHLFGNTFSLFERTLKPFGIEFRYADLTNPKAVGNIIDQKTKAVFFETITNPQLEVVDVKELSNITKKREIILIADTTLTPPYLFDSKKFDIDIEIISCTKYISGGATSVGGIIIDNGTYNWSQINKLTDEVSKYGQFALLAKIRKEVYRNLGACLSPFNAYLQTLGLETLSLRVDKSCKNSLALARWLTSIPEIKNVNYPGLEDSKYYSIANKQFLYPGSIITFELDSKEKCFQFMNELKIIRRATNLNDNKSLIIHPASTIFCEYDEKTLSELNVSNTMIRLAVGIEDINDLKTDIQNAIKLIK